MGIPGNSPVRNQIDYILIKQKARKMVKNCRTYNGTTTYADHRIVICDIELKWYNMFQRKKIKPNKFDMQKLKNETIRRKCTGNVKEKLYDGTERKDAQEQWNSINDACVTGINFKDLSSLHKIAQIEVFLLDRVW